MAINVTIRQIRIFIAVAKEESFTVAAGQLCLTQSTLTKAIRELENCTGIKLFERTTRKVALTNHGELFLPIAQRLLNDFDLSISNLCNQASGHSGTIRISSITALSTTLIPSVIKTMHTNYPELRIELQEDICSGVINRVATGEVDFGFCSNIEEIDSRLVAKKMLTARLGVIFPENQKWITDHISTDVLKTIKFIDGNQDVIISKIINSGSINKKTTNNIITQNLATQLSLVRAGVGPCIISALDATNPIASEFKFILIDNHDTFRDLYILHRKEDFIQPAVHTFLKELYHTLISFKFHKNVSIIK